MKEILKSSFTFKSLFQIRKKTGYAFFWYFVLIIIFSSLPLNLLIIRQNGWRLNAIVSNLENEDLAWLPNDLPISFIVDANNGLISLTDDTIQYVFETSKYTIIINGAENNYEIKANLIVLTKEAIIYYNDQQKPIIGTYSSLKQKVDFQYLTKMEDKLVAKHKFIEIFKVAFAPYFILSSVILWTAINLLMQIVLLFTITSIFLLIRINYQKVASYREYLKIHVASYTIPTIISVIVGLISENTATLSPVILQFGTALMAIGTIYLGSKSEVNHAIALKDTI